MPATRPSFQDKRMEIVILSRRAAPSLSVPSLFADTRECSMKLEAGAAPEFDSFFT